MSGQKSTKHTATETQTEQTPAHHYFSSAVKNFSDMSEESVHKFDSFKLWPISSNTSKL